MSVLTLMFVPLFNNSGGHLLIEKEVEEEEDGEDLLNENFME